MKRYIIIVAGYEFHSGQTDFSLMANSRKNYLLQHNPSWSADPDIVFVRFDFKNGSIETNTSANRNNWSIDFGSFEAIRRGFHYDGTHFKQADTRVMSITDAYWYIMNIGATEPGTVLEFSVISHGWYGGPALINCFQRPEYGGGGAQSRVRDPWDKDARPKDFWQDNMSEADWNNFVGAFAPEGYCWVWGCVFTKAYFQTLSKVINSSDYRRKRLGEHTDDDTFTISVDQTFVNDYYDADRIFFPTSNTERTFTRTLLQLKTFLKRGIVRSYCGRVTADTGIECRAAYLGTYADYEQVADAHYPIMLIPRNMAYGSDFTPFINFYKTYFNISEDPENRGYARYLKSDIDQWWQDIN